MNLHLLLEQLPLQLNLMDDVTELRSGCSSLNSLYSERQALVEKKGSFISQAQQLGEKPDSCPKPSSPLIIQRARAFKRGFSDF